MADLLQARPDFPSHAFHRLEEWPTTEGLGMTPRTEALTRLLADDQSPVDP